MELFLKRTKGSITVLVTLLLVPTIFFTSFLVDLARLKLYGNQAVMTADNYGEAVLSQYDNLLKELYGLFAVTQDEEALRELDKLQEYMKSSFDPSKNTISWEHLQAIPGITTSYEGFMPYASAQVTLDREWIAGADLRNEAVLATQTGDFMRFRIAQQLTDDGSALLEAISQIQNAEGDAKAVKAKRELDEEAEKLFDAAREYYLQLKKFTLYPDYLQSVNRAYSECETSFLQMTDTTKDTSYKIYFDYETADPEALAAAVEKRDRIEAAEAGESGADAEGNSSESNPAQPEAGGLETLTEEEQELVNCYDTWEEDGNARREKLQEGFDRAITAFQRAAEGNTEMYPVNLYNFADQLDKLDKRAAKVQEQGVRLRTRKERLQQILDSEEVSDDLSTGIDGELEQLEELFDELDCYSEIAAFIRGYSGVNDGYKNQVFKMVDRMEEIRDAYLDCKDETEIPDWIEILDTAQWKDFRSDHDEKETLYLSLEKCFGANRLLDDAEKDLNEEEKSPARDIPQAFGYGKNGRCQKFKLSEMAGDAVALLSVNGLKNAANKLLLKLYLAEYDFGMFTSRVTGTDRQGEQDSGGKEVSLTGYEKTAKINYLYQAELEYLLGGYNSSDQNLGEARNKILAFRAVINFRATYSIREINNSIKSIAHAASVINPILGVTVNGALRLAVAGVETAADWKALKEGESVIVLKNKLQHLTSLDSFQALLGIGMETAADEKAFRMDYEQYLQVMILFLPSFGDLAQRTANLIELNVNTVRQKIGEDGVLSSLEFQMKDAHTAVNASCTVHLDFAVIPSSFAKAVAADNYSRLTQAERNHYQFTVTRGY